MSSNALSNPTAQINDDTISYTPNSLSYKLGGGDVNVRTQTAGGGAISTVVTENAESRMSMVKFGMLLTDTNRNLIRTWQEARATGGNTIRLSGDSSQIPLSFTGMQLVTDPEYSVGSDGSVEVEFMGDPA